MVFGFVAGLTPFSTVVKAMVVGSFPRRARNAMIRGEGATSELTFRSSFSSSSLSSRSIWEFCGLLIYLLRRKK
jgi:hypothetical protein